MNRPPLFAWQQAAELLNVSRPYVVMLLEEGQNPINREKLAALGEKVWPGGGGKEILHLVD